ncbi:nucleoside deaminase [Phenylobacterium sp.]|uniref:nucleoside deaminase n=1 Tax=Phenylobacterium sp. TaxID=1871053 RepID=UPI0035AF432F
MQSYDAKFLNLAITEALEGAAEGGVAVGAALSWRGALVSKGRNRRQQKKTVILHGEMDCLANAGLFKPFSETTMYTTLSPCKMCSGAIAQFRIARVVIADAVNFGGNEEFLRASGVEVVIVNDEKMIKFFREWKGANEKLWNGDIGV